MISRGVLEAVKNHARALLDRENELYASKSSSKHSSRQFLSTIMSSGTLSDRVSALTLVVQESPLHNMKAFESLINLAGKRSRAQAVGALEALKDLLAQGTMLPDRRLRTFDSQPGFLQAFSGLDDWNSSIPLPSPLKDADLLSWIYEDWLKSRYFQILQILEAWCNDEVQFARSRALGIVWELLKEKPEQESNLLRLLVNKLGDPDKKISSQTSYLISKLMTTHPRMKPIIIAAVESELLFRPGQSMHAKYYAIITLNQTILSSAEAETAQNLLKIYFGLFAGLLKRNKQHDSKQGVSQEQRPLFNKKGELQGGGAPAGKRALKKGRSLESSVEKDDAMKDKMVSALLTGINRALPYSSLDRTA